MGKVGGDPRSLRRLFRRAGVLFSGLAVAAVIALLASTAYFRSVADDMSETVESLRLTEDVQAQLLGFQHARTTELLSGDRTRAHEAVATAARLTRLVEQAVAHASSDADRKLLGELREAVDRYLATTSTLTPGVASADLQIELLTSSFDDAFGKAQAVIQNDLELARVQHQHASIQRMAGATAAVISVGLLLVLVFLGRSLRAALFAPLDQVSEAIRAYAHDRSRRAPEIGSTELEHIARAFNLAAAELQAQRENQVRFLAGVAHDLRNPLGALQSALALVRPDRPLPDEVHLRRVLLVARRSLDRLNIMVEDLLDLSRAELGHLPIVPDLCDLREIVRDSASLFDATGSSIQVVLPDAPVTAWCDSSRITQVVNNLVSNAIKYSREGGVVRIAARPDAEVGILEVSDTGMGIPSQDLEAIFEPFRRSSATQDVPGVGLGLFICKQIVDAHRGRLTVDSSPGIGSTFRISLPRAP